MLSAKQIKRYHEEGFLVVPALFSMDEVTSLRSHYEVMRQHEVTTQVQAKSTFAQDDPLRAYPRLMQPHRRDERSLQWLVDERLNRCTTALLTQEPYAVQTMFYFKPPGARGQALHQDQYFLRAQPGTCMAAWMAVDDCDEQNGCLRVVPGSHEWPLLCTTQADTAESFTDIAVDLPKGMEAVPVRMAAGDVLFFNGQIVHGSLPNVTTDRFRRALIGHYIVGEAEKVYKYYHPVLRMDGTTIAMDISDRGGTCGTWVDRDGEPVLEMLPAVTAH